MQVMSSSYVRTLVGTSARTLRAQSSRAHRQRERLVQKGMLLPPMPSRRRSPGEVWGIAMVKNEIDVLPSVIQHMFEQGIDRILVADNGSTDGTLEYLKGLADGLQFHVAIDSEPGYYQSAKMTRLARAAWRSGADWIIPFDADEFWFGDRETLAEGVRHIDGDVVSARIYNVFPRRSGDWGMDVSPQLHGKVAFRSHRLALLGMGNHDVDRPGRRVPLEGAHLQIAHLPWRSFDQFVNKVRQGRAAYEATDLAPALGNHWRHMGQQKAEELKGQWARILDGKPVPGMHWCPRGELVGVDIRSWRTWDPFHVVPRSTGAALKAWD